MGGHNDNNVLWTSAKPQITQGMLFLTQFLMQLVLALGGMTTMKMPLKWLAVTQRFFDKVEELGSQLQKLTREIVLFVKHCVKMM